MDLEAVIKSAASAASRKARSGASLDLGPLDLIFLEAALAADLIKASKSVHGSTVPTPLQPLSGPCSIEILSRMANRFFRIFDAG